MDSCVSCVFSSFLGFSFPTHFSYLTVSILSQSLKKGKRPRKDKSTVRNEHPRRPAAVLIKAANTYAMAEKSAVLSGKFRKDGGQCNTSFFFAAFLPYLVLSAVYLLSPLTEVSF